MKFLILLFCNFLSVFSFAAEVCNLDFKNYRLQAPIDCYKCVYDQKFPSDKVEQTVNPVMGFIMDSEENQILLRKMQVMEHFLRGKNNATTCSNYNDLKKQFNTEFTQQVALCEKGPDLLNKKKKVCSWVLETYAKAINDSFYSYWSYLDEKGNVQFIKGRNKEDLEPSIRSFNNWCNKVLGNYKNKIFLSCSEARDWVKEFDMVKRISDSIKKSLEDSQAKESPEDARKKMFDEGCKYFDKNAATTFTKDLYLACLTR